MFALLLIMCNLINILGFASAENPNIYNVNKPFFYSEAAMLHVKARKYGQRLHRGRYSLSCNSMATSATTTSTIQDALLINTKSRRYSPVNYGGDPTGQTDSTKAVQSAMHALLASNNASLPNMASGIQN